MTTDHLVQYLQHRAGDTLRGTVEYEGNDVDILYLRDDVAEQRIRSEIDQMVSRMKPETSPQEDHAFPFGSLHGTVRMFDDAVLVHLPKQTEEGVVVALEPAAARTLHSFIEECEARLNSSGGD